ncbi:MAG: tyrosine-protein phosphatase [Cellvibrionaceae bacterium]|nr:tyrosine-protein phosphatase [Cellvibrionaceae bacterium]
MAQLDTRWGRIKAYAQAYFVDHGILRKCYRNFYAISARAYRSNHPGPRFIKKIQREHGIRSIINLRGRNTTGQYLLEKEACDQLGITLIDASTTSRHLPEVKDILALKAIFESAEHPLLIHCKSGADRAGLASVLYQHFIDKKPIADALSQLSWKYGHFRWADTGKLDYFFDAFLAFEKNHPDSSFLEWLQHSYDRSALDQAFTAAGWANILVNHLLRRE